MSIARLLEDNDLSVIVKDLTIRNELEVENLISAPTINGENLVIAPTIEGLDEVKAPLVETDELKTNNLYINNKLLVYEEISIAPSGTVLIGAFTGTVAPSVIKGYRLGNVYKLFGFAQLNGSWNLGTSLQLDINYNYSFGDKTLLFPSVGTCNMINQGLIGFGNVRLYNSVGSGYVRLTVEKISGNDGNVPLVWEVIAYLV